MKRKQFLACLLAMMTTACTIGATTISANAQEINGEPVATILPSEDSQVVGVFPSKETQTADYKGNNEISSFKIGDLDAPEEGKLLDFSAVVNADNGAAWKIPVIWADEDGRLTTVKSSKVNSFPVFAFYMPKGYTIKDAQTILDRIELPKAATDVYAGRKVVKIVDSKTGWVFITCLDGPGKNLEVNAAAADFADIVKQFGEAEKGNRNANQGGGESSNQTENSFVLDYDSLTPEQKLAVNHSDISAIKEIGIDKLASLVELVRYTIEPQAVSLLLDGFPCFNDALLAGELSSTIGLYVYSNDDGNAAYVQPEDSDDPTLGYYVAVNVLGKGDKFTFNTESNKWELNEQERSELESTMVHEMLHRFMFDYTARGMNGQMRAANNPDKLVNIAPTNFPRWFTEGIATAVENGFQARCGNFYGKEYGYVDDVWEYSADSLKEGYTNNQEVQLQYGEPRYDENGDEIECDNTASSYASGYLACMYLSYLAASNDNLRTEYNIQGEVETTLEDGTVVYNHDALRQGLSAILSEIHGYQANDGNWYSYSLDDVIENLLGAQGVNNTEEFQADFISSIPGSAEFCAQLLQHYDDNSTVDTTSSGSLLLPTDSTELSPLNQPISTRENLPYTIVDNSENGVAGFTVSDANNTFLDGGKTYVNPSEVVIDETEYDQAAAKAASKTDTTTTEGEE
ncbi:MAG: hypothetical protein K6D38_12490 [Pseudobutyrivibrio sp.]|nr:hypothetical protein [Pseudobutyrivibrio sp.]